jgi:hypothetical protein
MKKTNPVKICKSCGSKGKDDFCSHCGQPFTAKRISIPGILFDVFHLFTKFEKGFGYTLKQLIIAPGTMQLDFLEGDRRRHQKPFSMFFICATFSALSRYWLFILLYNYSYLIRTAESAFFKEYMVFLYIGLTPVYTLIAYLFFYKSGYNYAEMIVLFLYTLSVFFIASPFIFLLKFIWPHLDTAYVEFPFYTVYLTITFIRFFKRMVRWKVILICLAIITMAFLINDFAEDFIIRIME